jgi:hypothetical protein
MARPIAAVVHGGPEPQSAQEARSQEAAYEPRMTPPISTAVHLDHGSKHCGHARVGKGAGRLTLTLQSALVRDVVLPNLAISVRSCIRWSLRRDFPAARCLLTCRRHAGGIDGAQSMAWPLFRARRVALDLYVPGHRSNTLSSIRQAAVSA